MKPPNASPDNSPATSDDIFSEDFKRAPKISEDFVQKLQKSFLELGIPPSPTSVESLIDDLEFDQILPPLHRFLSSAQWTSINVAQLVAKWLSPYQNKKFLDAGSGVGKLCILLRYLTDLEIYGVEQRESLVKISQEIIQTNALHRITFEQRNIHEVKFADYDIIYLYNPFQEHVCYSETLIIDKTIELDRKFFLEYTAKIFEELKNLKKGSVLITFHGYGGKVPKTWTLKYNQFVEGGFLSMWVKD